MFDLCLRCWNHDPNRRPTAKNVAEQIRMYINNPSSLSVVSEGTERNESFNEEQSKQAITGRFDLEPDGYAVPPASDNFSTAPFMRITQEGIGGSYEAVYRRNGGNRSRIEVTYSKQRVKSRDWLSVRVVSPDLLSSNARQPNYENPGLTQFNSIRNSIDIGSRTF